MKIKAIVKALVKGAELALTLWAVGVAVGHGFRDGQKNSDFFEEKFYDHLKNRKIRRLQRKLQKLSKKEQLTEDEKKQQEQWLKDILEWSRFNTREMATLGTTVEGGFDIHYENNKEEQS